MEVRRGVEAGMHLAIILPRLRHMYLGELVHHRIELVQIEAPVHVLVKLAEERARRRGVRDDNFLRLSS